MGFFQKLTRSRSNSYVEDDDDHSAAYTTPKQSHGHETRPPTSYKSVNAPDNVNGGSSSIHSASSSIHASPAAAAANSITAPAAANNTTAAPATMYQRPPQQPQSHEAAFAAQQRPVNSGNISSRPSAGRDSGYGDEAPQTPMDSKLQAPDLLTRAFHEALRPYTDKIDALEQQLADMQAFLDQMEAQRMDVFAWIDKRGLRPDVPPQIAKQMDTTPDAAAALNGQLDRKMTIVNFDLHRLQDDLNESISSSHFASAMAKFLPDIQRLADIPTGPRFAYELIIKLVGNLNAHGGLEAGGSGTDAELDEDRRARAGFYARMDEELVDVIARRSQEGEDWPIAREVKRLEKNAAYLKNLGIDSYFPRSLDAMRRQADSFPGGAGTPPRY